MLNSLLSGRRQTAALLNSAIALGTAVLAFSLTGCERTIGYTGKVRGTVTLDGKPLTSGNVISTPLAGGRGAIGDIQNDGSFVLKTGRDIEGVAAGKHLIAVVAYQPSAATEPLLESNGELSIPERYADAARSGLTVEVAAGEEQVIDLRLVTEH